MTNINPRLISLFLIIILPIPDLAALPSGKLNLNENEQNWLKSHPAVSFTGDPNWLPYESFDEDGNYIGIVAEHLSIISEITGLQFKMSPSKTWTESTEKAKQGLVDILSETDDSDLKSHLNFTTPYISNPIVIAMRNNENYVEDLTGIKSKKIALIKDYGYTSKIRKKYSNIQFHTVNDIHDGLISVSTGKVDALLCTLALCTYTISELGLNNVKITGKTEFDTKLALGVQKNIPELLSILNKSIKLITSEQQQVILDGWIKDKFVEKTDYTLIIQIIVFASVLLAIFAFWNRRLSREINLRKNTEAELKFERDFAASILNTAPVIVLLLDPRGCIKHVNPYFEQLSGYQLEEIKDKEWVSSFLPVRDQSRIRELLKKTEQEASVKGNINPIITRDGEERDIEWYAETMHDTNGNVSGILSIGQDVTERTQSEQALKQSEAGLNEAQHLAKVGSWELNLLTNHLVWSDEIFHMFEVDKTQFDASYDAFLNAIHPDDRDTVNKAYTDSLVNQKLYEIKHRLQMSDGSIKYVKETCKTDFDSDGNPLRSVGTVQDISELYKAEQEIERLASIVKKSSDFIGIADIEGKPLFLNDSGRKLVGIQDDNQLFSSRVIDFFPPPAQETFNTEIMPTLMGKGQWMGEINFRNFISGEDIAVWFNVFRIDHPITGQPKSIATVTRDIRKQKAVDAELKLHREHLEELVEERTTHMKNALDEAEQANAAKSQFLSSMSHELRTPMNAILGFSQLLAMNAKDEETKDHLKRIINAGDQLLELINQVLDLSKIESANMSLLINSHSLYDLLNDCLSLINPIAAEQSITIDNKVDPSLNTRINVDEGRFKQVLLNILSNAIKYNSENGKVTIDCSSNDKNMLCLSISDTGKGLTPEQKSHLFKAFDRAGAENSNISGTGLGLVISKDLMEKMNGTIDFDSEVGKGSCFWIKIPSS